MTWVMSALTKKAGAMIAPAVVIGTSFASRLRDELLVHVDLEALDAAFVAVTGVLDAAERRLGRRDGDRVHADHAGLERITDRGGGLRRRREGVSRKPELERVRTLHHLIERLERDDRRDRAERLLGYDLGIVRHVGDDGRLEEEALVAGPIAAGDDLAAAVLGVLHEGIHRIEPARI